MWVAMLDRKLRMQLLNFNQVTDAIAVKLNSQQLFDISFSNSTDKWPNPAPSSQTLSSGLGSIKLTILSAAPLSVRNEDIPTLDSRVAREARTMSLCRGKRGNFIP
eukprot:sb/3477867/